ncbi:MAG TPA: HupE/UreJ family protein [Cellvibrionaceae bacterium]
MHIKKILAISAGLCPSLAFAHVSSISSDGFSGGIMHTLSGADHLAALWCLGALAALFALSPKTTSGTHVHKNWFWLPILFALGAITGAYLGVHGWSVNPEPIIGFSVLFWGGLIVARKHLTLAAQAVASIIFALFHGLAHGPVLAQLQQPLAFYAGLTVGFGACFTAGFIATQALTSTATRWLAGGVSLIGLGYFLATGSFN